jgi:alpha-glucosidase
VRDPIGRRGWPLEKGRDGERTPMQWTDGPNAGFTTGTPWLPIPPSYKTHNVATEAGEQNSVFTFYRQLLALRHEEAALRDGEYTALNESDPNVFTYVRRYKDEAILVLLNMSGTPQKARFGLASLGFSSPKVSVLLTSFHQPPPGSGADIPMEPYSVFIAKITK